MKHLFNKSIKPYFVVIVTLLLITPYGIAHQHDTEKKHKQHSTKYNKQGGHHGGHGATIKGVEKFPTIAYIGSPKPRAIERVKAPKMKGNPQKGKKIAYNRKIGRCLNCHVLGVDSKQAGTVGPNLSNFGNFGRSDDYIFQQIWDGRAHNPQTLMPPMGTNGLLTKHQVVHIVAYLKTLKNQVSTKTRPPKDTLNLLVAGRDFTLADDYLEQGKVLFNKPGKNGKSCASCHQDNNNSLVGVASTYPKASKHKIINLEQKINMHRQQKMHSHPYKLGSQNSNKLTSYIKYLSRDMAVNVSTNKHEQNALKRGKASFYKKTGQLNFSCADCHAKADNQWLGGQYLSSIKPNGSYSNTAATWPRHFIAGHDLGLISLQQRIRHCQVVTRSLPLKLGSQEYTDMELYLTYLANGKPMLAPTKSNLSNE